MPDQSDRLPVCGISTTHYIMDLDQERIKTFLLQMTIRGVERQRRLQRLMKYASQPGLVLESHGVFAATHSSRHTANAFMKDLVAEPTHNWIGPMIHAGTEYRILIDDSVNKES